MLAFLTQTAWIGPLGLVDASFGELPPPASDTPALPPAPGDGCFCEEPEVALPPQATARSNRERTARLTYGI